MPDLATIGDLWGRGLSVIPLAVRSKRAAVKWEPFQDRRPNLEELEGWFGNGHAYNVGIVTGAVSGLVAVDCDSPEAIAWADAHLPPTPMITRTAKGEHRFYRHPGISVSNKAKIHTADGRLALDVRGDGGYVVAPGSIHETGVAYERIGTWPPIAELPLFDPAWIAPPPESRHVPRPTGRATAKDRDQVHRRARAYLEATPPAIEGQGGDEHTFQVCCRLVRGFDLSDVDALDLLREWNARCVPPWSERELEEKIGGARKYGTEPPGGRLDDPRHVRLPQHTPSRPAPASDSTAAETDTSTGVQLEDFHAYMPMHSYIFAPSRELWPAASVNARIAPVPLLQEDGTPALDDAGKARTLKATVWLDQQRAVEQMTWIPGEPMLIRDRLVSDGGWIERPGCTTFNLYRPPRRQSGNAQQVGPWLDHIRLIYPGDADHIVAWLAHRVQRPSEKVNHALVLGGLQGIGKDTLLEPVKHAIGPWNFAEVSPAHLLGRFNGFVKSVILRISEARDLGEVDRYSFYDHTKNYTAAPPDVLRVDEKNLREYAVWNVCGVVITTNHRTDGLYLPADDRRHYVGWSEATKQQFAPDYWTRLYGWYARGGMGHVAAYLAEFDLSAFDPKAPPPKTAAFYDVVDANRAPEDAELADALDRLGNPPAVTLSDITGPAPSAFADWLKDRKNARQVPHRLEAAGYVAVRNPHAKDGHWRVQGRRQAVYARHDLTPRDRLRAAAEVGGDR